MTTWKEYVETVFKRDKHFQWKRLGEDPAYIIGVVNGRKVRVNKKTMEVEEME